LYFKLLLNETLSTATDKNVKYVQIWRKGGHLEGGVIIPVLARLVEKKKREVLGYYATH
jgi:hypothetical protein